MTQIHSNSSNLETFLSRDNRYQVRLMCGDVGDNASLLNEGLIPLGTERTLALVLDNETIQNVSPPVFRTDTEAFYVNNDGQGILYFIPKEMSFSVVDSRKVNGKKILIANLVKKLALKQQGFFVHYPLDTYNKIRSCEEGKANVYKIDLNEIRKDKAVTPYGSNALEVRISISDYAKVINDNPYFASITNSNFGRDELLEKNMKLMRTNGVRYVEVRIHTSDFVINAVPSGYGLSCQSYIDFNSPFYAVIAYAEPQQNRETHILGMRMRDKISLSEEERLMPKLKIKF